MKSISFTLYLMIAKLSNILPQIQFNKLDISFHPAINSFQLWLLGSLGVSSEAS